MQSVILYYVKKREKKKKYDPNVKVDCKSDFSNVNIGMYPENKGTKVFLSIF